MRTAATKGVAVHGRVGWGEGGGGGRKGRAPNDGGGTGAKSASLGHIVTFGNPKDVLSCLKCTMRIL